MARILVVDDDGSNRRMFMLSLEAEGHQIAVVQDGAEGLKAAQREEFDLVITDFDMPNMMGNALSVELKKLKPVMPILMVSGDPEPSGHRADDFLAKPFRRVEFLDKVGALLRKP